MPIRRRIRRMHPPLVIVLLVVIVAGFAAPRAASGQRWRAGGIVHGYVRDHRTGQGVAATVHIDDQIVRTGTSGAIPTTTIPFHTPTRLVDVAVQAPGYPTWHYADVELAHAHPVELHVELGAPSTATIGMQAQAAPDAATAHPPDFINIGRTFNSACVYPPTNVQRIDRVPFMVYVRNVLPYEWIASWPDASLDAGAVAATQFAWSTALVHRKWTARGYSFDVLDSTCDQVYQDRLPTQHFRATDDAVARMWGTILMRDNEPITTFFRNTDERCAEVGGPDCMGQYGSRDRANEGMSGLDILRYYYDPITPTVRLPAERGVVWERTPDLVLWPGAARTVTARLLNVGAWAWERAYTEVRVVDPANAANTAYRSPFRHTSWIDAQRPTQLGGVGVGRGQDNTLRFEIAAPATLPLGTYQLALRLQHPDGTVIPIEPPLVWNVIVAPPVQPVLWLPVVR